MSKQNLTRVAVIVAIAAIAYGFGWAGGQGSVDAGSISAFAWCGIAAFVINGVGFLHSWATKSEKYYDITGTATYITMTIVALITASDLSVVQVITALLVVIWTSRLGVFLFRRIVRAGHDRRFAAILQNPMRLLVTWALQALWAFLVAGAALAIVTSADEVSFGLLTVIGLVLWIAGFAIEVVADSQKSAFRSVPANENRFITSGLWAWSRHPNYFGEVLLWLGVAVIALPVLNGWSLVALVSPVFTYLLLRYVSGVPMLERRANKVWGEEPDYQRYVATTPVLFPRPPRAA